MADAEVQAIHPEALSINPEINPEISLEPEPATELSMLEIPVATAAPLATSESGASQVLGLPLQFLNQLLQKLGATPLESLADLVPALQILALAVLAGIALKLTGATLGAINEIPLVGGLLELVGLVALLNSLARNAFKQQQRAELLDRIRKLRKDLLG